MSVIDWIVTVYAILFCLAWYISFVITMRSVLSIRLFEKENPPLPNPWPSLTIVIAACNESGKIEEAISTILQQDYPDLEIVLVNDRSTDNTGEIIEKIARRDSRVQPVQVEYLPAGWLGKVHALQVGTQRARGEWILYTDADVHFRPGTLRKAVALALADKSDHLTLLPKPDTPSFWLEVVMQTFGLLYMQGTRAAEVSKPGSSAVVGAGAFNLVKRSALDRTEGFPWLRMEVVDDVGLGLMLNRSGAKSSFAISVKDVFLTWYPSMSAMFKGLEKNFFGTFAHFRITKMTLIVAWMWAYALAPTVAILYLKVPYLLIFGAGVYFSLVVGAIVGKIKFKQKVLPFLFIQVGQIIISLMLLHSGIMCKVRGGVIWRGTTYTIDDLRAGQRLKF